MKGNAFSGKGGKPAWFSRLTGGACAAAFLLALWLIAYEAAGNDYLIPSLGASLRETGRILSAPGFWRAFGGTFSRTLFAFFLSFAAALVCSVVAYLLPAFGRFLSPLISVVRSLPTMAVILIILVWTTPSTAPVIVAFLALFPMLCAGMGAALAAVPPDLIEMSRIYRVPVQKRIFCLYLPCAAPYMLREGAAALSFSLKLVVSAEVLANTYQSLGGLLQEAKLYAEMPRLFALTLTVIAVGFLLEGAGALIARLARGRVSWKSKR